MSILAWNTNNPEPGLENKLINALYSCEPDKWIPQFETAGKSLLNVHKVHVSMEDHPFVPDMQQIWIFYDKFTAMLFVKKKGQPGSTELAAYVYSSTVLNG